jgi:hypothetical protein
MGSRTARYRGEAQWAVDYIRLSTSLTF